jgi:hypothetical protein
MINSGRIKREYVNSFLLFICPRSIAQKSIEELDAAFDQNGLPIIRSDLGVFILTWQLYLLVDPLLLHSTLLSESR